MQTQQNLEESLTQANQKISGNLPFLTKAGRNIAILFMSGSVISGCVGGPGSYFETVSRENRENANQVASAQLSVEETETNELPPITNGSSVVEAETANSQPAIETANTTTTLLQNPDGTLVLAPKSTQQQPEAQPLENAYANPQLASVLPQPLGAAIEDNILQTGPGTGFAIGAESSPIIDPLEQAAESRIPLIYAQIQHGQCKSGRGPSPKKLSATNINPGDPYYIEIRMRKTPLLPVGHTYVAYGKLGADGEILDEKLIMLAPVGGYAGAALASGIPMPGILTPHRDDCRIRPETGYRVSLNAQRYEKLLREVAAAKQETPSYLLFAFNCNHFMTRMAESAGLKPPKNIYVPALEYIYAMIENNEGRPISRR